MAYTRFSNTFDAGTQGATVTAANSSTSGTAFTQVFGTGINTYDSAAAIQGARGMLSETAASVAAFYADFGVAVAAGGLSFEFSLASLPGADFHIGRLVDSSQARAVSIHVSNTNRLRFSDLTGTANGIWTATNPLVAGTRYRVELWAKAGSTSTTGEIRGAYFLAGSTTVIETFTLTTASIATGTPFKGVIFGRITSSAIQLTVDSVVWEMDSTGLPGPYVTPATALATPVIVLGATVNPTTIGGTNGKQTVTWSAVANAVSYEAWIAHSTTPAQGDFTLVATGVTSPYQFTGLPAGTHAYGVKAKA